MFFIASFFAACLASDAMIVTVNVAGEPNLPKIQVFEFWDGKSSLFSTHEQQLDPRWKKVGPAFCVAAAVPVGSTDYKPLTLWSFPQTAVNRFDNCFIDDTELSPNPYPAIGSKDKFPIGHLYLGIVGYVAKNPMKDTVPLQSYFFIDVPGVRGKHHFATGDIQTSIKGQQKLDPKDNDSYNWEKTSGHVWAKC